MELRFAAAGRQHSEHGRVIAKLMHTKYPTKEEDGVSIKYFNDDGVELLSRHPRNDRHEEVTIMTYVGNILKELRS
jgi:hypothetical protein